MLAEPVALPRAVGGNIATSLLEHAVEVLHETANMHGHLAGCNAIFMECSVIDGGGAAGAPPPRARTRRSGGAIAPVIMNVGHSHARMAELGFQMLDLVFSQPPLYRLPDGQLAPAVSLSLTVYTRDSPLPRLLLPLGRTAAAAPVF